MGIIIRNTEQGGKVKVTSLGLGGGFKSNVITQQGSSPLLLDTYSGAGVAYSLRKLKSDYAGSAIRVRRSSDNTEQDIGFVNNQLDTASLQSFVGSTNILPYSEDFSLWPLFNSATINSNVTTDPLGGNTADRLNFGALNTSQVYWQPFTFQGLGYNLSVYAKSDTKSKFRLKIYNGFQDFYSSDFTTTSTWTRYDVTLTPGAGTTGNIGIINESAGGTGAIFIWGAQLTTRTLQPYVQTTGTAVTSNRDGFVTRWYDQSGNAITASQSTAANQPRIINTGSIEAQGSRPSMWFIPSSVSKLTTTTNVSVGSYMSTFIVTKMDEITGGYKYITSIGTPAASSNSYAIVLKAGGGFQDWTAGDAIAFGRGYSPGVGPRVISNGNVYNNIFALTSVFLGSDNTGFYVNGSAVTTKALTQGNADNTNTANTLIIGSIDASNPYDGYLSELIIYKSNQFSNKAGIETNINSNYSIY